ncbi:Sugar phosphate permease [Geodermatophilus dictyosporus]|uniref:Sugar phosphate permease n=1 Tax=Geodermatophilus dictyosporus TaxID=1523247 RepID=A0A1I5TWN3_9ACTN|nr:MFS transporter [Geodermatophilus dictyosporus]SFP87007.1 Sugar phosphate permease [Geodermatophilus dictyosporus]
MSAPVPGQPVPATEGLLQAGPPRRQFAPFTRRETNTAMVLALLAWTIAVFDYGLFGTLLPAMQGDFGWDDSTAYLVNTLIAIGTAIVAFGVGPVIDRLGRRRGMMVTIGGTAVASALTAILPTKPAWAGVTSVVAVRSLGGLGFSEQSVNATYLNEVFAVTEDERKRARPGLWYAFVQGGWPLGFLLSSALALVALDTLGWRGMYVVAAIPAVVLIVVIGKKLRETPQFQLQQQLSRLKAEGRGAEAQQLAADYGVEHSDSAPIARIFQPGLRRNTIVLSAAWIINFFGINIFSVLGTSVLANAKGVELSTAFWMLIVINLGAYFGYVFHGWLGDRIGRKKTIVIGWMISGLAFATMLAPFVDSAALIVTTYAVGLFFLVGPYAAILFYMGECYPTDCRGTGTVIIGAMSQPGTIIGGFLFTAVTAASDTGTAALWVGALGTFVSGLLMLFAKPVAELKH